MPEARSRLLAVFFFFFLLYATTNYAVLAQDVFSTDYGDASGDSGASPPPPALENCNGVFLTYTFTSREREYPKVKNASAQAYAFKAQATVFNAMAEELQAWKMYIGFQHREIIVAASGAVLVDGNDFPADVRNGTTISGWPQADLPDSITTAGDFNQIQAMIDITGTQFGLKPPGVPMPKNIKLTNEGFICPKATRKGSNMYVCCTKDKKYKKKKSTDAKFLPRQYGDLNIAYDVLQAYDTNYMAQVTIDNINPLGRLDNWNLTWEWKRGEFIYGMKGAYTYKKEYSECIYGEAGQYYKGLDFTQVMNCQKKPVITDLPPEREKDDKIGNIPNCCKNGTLLPPTMNASLSHSQSIFQLQVYKLPPDMNRTALYPPQNWKINGFLNPQYKCGAPMRVSPTVFPDSSGLMSESYALATWQVVCNITRPKAKQSRCCVSFSAFYNTSVVPCNTCACGCPDEDGSTCNPDARALLLPSNALLIPFENRTSLAREWAKLKHFNFPRRLPCPDNCGVSINWHIVSDYRKGWSARITLFNWEDYTFKDWFAAIQIPKAYKGYEKVYSFNGTMLPELNHTIFFNGLEGLNYLMPEMDDPKDPDNKPRVPGKQQSVISFTKKDTPNIEISRGDGFPKRVYFNGEECALPDHLPTAGGSRARSGVLVPAALAAIAMFLLNV